jgi:PEP-CTERM motif
LNAYSIYLDFVRKEHIMKLKALVQTSLLTVGLVSLAALPSQAAKVVNNPLPAATCASGSVSAVGLGSYTSCIGSFQGNDVGAQGGLETQLSSGVFDGITDWNFVGKSDGSGVNVSGSNSGSWSVNTALTGPFVLSLKSSTAWSAYFFEGLDESFQVLGGQWNTLGVSTNNKGMAQDLSHATIYRAVVQPPTEEPTPIPEPATTAALGLVAVGAWGSRRKQKQA